MLCKVSVTLLNANTIIRISKKKFERRIFFQNGTLFMCQNVLPLCQRATIQCSKFSVKKIFWEYSSTQCLQTAWERETTNITTRNRASKIIFSQTRLRVTKCLQPHAVFRFVAVRFCALESTFFLLSFSQYRATQFFKVVMIQNIWFDWEMKVFSIRHLV